MTPRALLLAGIALCPLACGSFDDPTLPTCPPHAFDLTDGGSGCAIVDNGPPSDPAQPADVDRAMAVLDDTLSELH